MFIPIDCLLDFVAIPMFALLCLFLVYRDRLKQKEDELYSQEKKYKKLYKEYSELKNSKL